MCIGVRQSPSRRNWRRLGGLNNIASGKFGAGSPVLSYEGAKFREKCAFLPYMYHLRVVET